MSESRFSGLAEKLAVDSEPGLTTTQLMLVNHDLKPGKLKFHFERECVMLTFYFYS